MEIAVLVLGYLALAVLAFSLWALFVMWRADRRRDVPPPPFQPLPEPPPLVPDYVPTSWEDTSSR